MLGDERILLPREGVAKWMWIGVVLGLVMMSLGWRWPPANPYRLGAGAFLVLAGLTGLFGTRSVRISRQKITLVYAIGRLPTLRSSIALSSLSGVVPDTEGRSHLIRIYGRKRGEITTLDGFTSAEQRDEYLALVKTRLHEHGADTPA